MTALFRELGVDKRLTTLMEGESLFNDGMAVVAFSFLVALPLGTAKLGVQEVTLELISVIGIGLGVGGLIGFGISYLTQRFDLPLVEQSLTLVSAYGTYIIAEEFGGSGVIGVVTCGLVLGNFGSRIGMNPRTRVIVSEFWEFVAFFVNSIVFLLIGDQIRFSNLADNLGIIGITIAGMVVSRLVSVYALGFFSNRVANSNISLAEQTILWWGGLRGSVSIALALSVPTILGNEREDIISTVFGVVLFTLLVQGLTTKPLLKRLNLLGDQPLRQEYMQLVARENALQRVLKYLDEVDNERPGLDMEFCRYQEALIKGELSNISEKIGKLQIQHPSLKTFASEQLRNELLAVEADTYAEFVRNGRLNQELAPLLQDVLEEG